MVALSVAPVASATPQTSPAKLPPALWTIERNLADGLARAKTTQLLRYRRHRTKTPNAPVNQVEWVDLSNGQRRGFDYDAAGRLTGPSVTHPDGAPNAKWNPSGDCSCDLDPFTNFPGQALQVTLLGNQTVDGQPTFHLRFTVTGGPVLSAIDYWIGRSTSLPVRSHVVYRAASVNGHLGPTMSTTDEFNWFPRTNANLARLTSG
jgi:YD repeat-containing protein